MGKKENVCEGEEGQRNGEDPNSGGEVRRVSIFGYNYCSEREGLQDYSKASCADITDEERGDRRRYGRAEDAMIVVRVVISECKLTVQVNHTAQGQRQGVQVEIIWSR